MKQKPKTRKSVFLRLFVLAACAFFSVSMLRLWTKLDESKKQLGELKTQLSAEQNEVEELKEVLSSDSDTPLIEKAARDRLGYVYSDEQVFIDISGD